MSTTLICRSPPPSGYLRTASTSPLVIVVDVAGRACEMRTLALPASTRTSSDTTPRFMALSFWRDGRFVDLTTLRRLSGEDPLLQASAGRTLVAAAGQARENVAVFVGGKALGA